MGQLLPAMINGRPTRHGRLVNGRPGPYLDVNGGASLNLGTALQGLPGTAVAFSVYSNYLGGDITVETDSATVEVSSDGVTYDPSDITITVTSGSVGITTVYVRLLETLAAGAKSGIITITCDTLTVSVPFYGTVAANSLVEFWEFANATGGIASYAFTPAGTPVYTGTGGKTSDYVTLDATADTLTLTNAVFNAAMNGGGSYSVALVYREAATVVASYLLTYGSTIFQIAIDPLTNTDFVFFDSDTNDHTVSVATGASAAYHLIVATFDGANDLIGISIDGAARTTAAVTGLIPYNQPEASLVVPGMDVTSIRWAQLAALTGTLSDADCSWAWNAGAFRTQAEYVARFP